MNQALESEFAEFPDDSGFHQGTRWESVEEIRKAVKAQRVPTVKEQLDKEETDATLAFRPVRRPPMAVLCILDDGQEDGEKVRIRKEKLIIGRTDGDILIPHDSMMSARHAEIVRQVDKGRFTWMLIDLQSTNGTYIRVASALLKHEQEFLIGGRRYRFDAAMQGAAALAQSAAKAPQAGTSGWENIAPTDVIPSIVETTPQGEGKRIFIEKPDNWIGCDATQCSLVLADDPLVSPRHARLYRDKKGRWTMDNAGSLNGVWFRINKIKIENTGHFRLGEQRFSVRVFSS